MKRFTVILAMLMLAAMPTMAERVAPETARKAATTFLNNNGAKATQLTDLSKAAGFANLYIFTAEQGFVVMASDDCARPILGYSLTDRFDINNMPENMRWWLQQYSDEIQWGIENGIQPDNSTATEWENLRLGNAPKDNPVTIVSPLIQTEWGQGSPYNMYCPNNSVTGCVATAMAQVMKYWNYPEQGQGNHSYTPKKHPEYGELSADFSATTYDWGNMTDTYNSQNTLAEKEAVATLMYHCGVSVDMNYDPESSGAPGALAPLSLMNYFKYASSATYLSKDDYTNDQWIALLKLELDERRPVFYGGSYEKIVNNELVTGGHAFVCDGYRSDDKFHFNWGWNGSDGNGTDGGYWAIGTLNPLSGGIGSGSGTYNLYNGIAAWVEPVSSLAAPVISVTASGRSLVLSWEAIDEADSYIIYKDNQKIATGVTESSYTDNDIVSGSYYEYYVRAVNSDTISNPSNFATGMSVFRDITPSGLTAESSGNNVALSWTGYEGGQSYELHYGTTSDNRGWSADDNIPGTYWAQRYPAASIADFAGMEISKISCYFYYASTYTMYAFNGELSDTDKLCERSHTKAQAGMEWIDFNFDTPLQIDCSKDLWIVFYNNDANAPYPALSGSYSGTNASEGKYIAAAMEDLPDNAESQDISWLIRVNLTDGTYTYSLYDNGEPVVSGLAETNYTVLSPTSNTIHQYTVNTNYYGGQSKASNRAGITMGSASLASLEIGANDQMTLTEGSTLTVETLSNGNTENLIIENGAQLIHNSTGVKATVKKAITPYTGNNNGWNFIASPVIEAITPSSDNGLLSGNYDLYYYNEPTHYWKNHKNVRFNLAYMQGYLYANSTQTTLEFAGTLTPSNNSVTISNLSHSAETLNGFNLVGNPFACNATVDQDCYVINADRTKIELADQDRQIAPCEGAFVKATADNNYSVTFTKASSGAKGNSNGQNLDLVVTKGGLSTGSTPAVIDRARVRSGEGQGMEKFRLGNKTQTTLAFRHDGQDYAVAHANGLNELPLHFKATEDGTYTIAIEANSLDVDYLHLIDNMTGEDIDLLATSTGSVADYTFTAKTTDYESRFRLVFSADGGSSTGSEATNFAFVSNGEIIITTDTFDAADTFDVSLQVVDMMGRVIVSVGGHTRCVPTTGIPAGVYILRLIDGENIQTQKIVID